MIRYAADRAVAELTTSAISDRAVPRSTLLTSPTGVSRHLERPSRAHRDPARVPRDRGSPARGRSSRARSRGFRSRHPGLLVPDGSTSEQRRRAASPRPAETRAGAPAQSRGSRPVSSAPSMPQAAAIRVLRGPLATHRSYQIRPNGQVYIIQDEAPRLQEGIYVDPRPRTHEHVDVMPWSMWRTRDEPRPQRQAQR